MTSELRERSVLLLSAAQWRLAAPVSQSSCLVLLPSGSSPLRIPH